MDDHEVDPEKMHVVHIETWMILAVVAGLVALGYFTRWWVPIFLVVALTVYGFFWAGRNISCLSSGSGSDGTDSSDSN